MGLFCYTVGLSYFVYLSCMTFLGYLLPPYGTFEPYELTWVVTLSSISIWTYFKVKKTSVTMTPRKFKENYDFILVFLAILVVRFLYLQDRSIWLDENAQGIASVTNYFVSGGAGHHQPPSDFVFTRVGVLLSGFRDWGLRFHSALFSSLAAASLYFFIKRYARSAVLALGLSALFAFHFVVVKFGFEARPISHGLFLEILFLMGFFSVLKEPETSFLADKSWFLTLLTFLYLCSLGMQPVFVVAGVLVFCFFYGRFHSNVVHRTLHPLVYGLLAYLPLQFATYKLADPRFTKVGLFSMEAFLNQIPLIHYEMVSTFVKPFLYTCVALSVLYVLFAAYKRILKIGPDLFFAFTALFFTIVLMAYFESHIAWFLNDYYLVSIFPLSIMALAVSFRQIQDPISWGAKSLWALAVAVVLACSWSYSWAPFHKFSEVYIQNDMKGAFDVVARDATQKPIILSLCFHQEKGWCAPFLIAEKYYTLQNAGLDIAIGKNSVDLLRSVPHLTQLGDIYFFYYTSWSGPAPQEIPNDKKIATLSGVEVYKIAGGDKVYENILSFLKPAFDASLKKGRLHSFALDYILFAYDQLHDKEQLLKYLKIYTDFQGEKNGTSYISFLLEQNRLHN